MTLDRITDKLLKSWEQAGGIYAIAAKEVRAELEEGGGEQIRNGNK